MTAGPLMTTILQRRQYAHRSSSSEPSKVAKTQGPSRKFAQLGRHCTPAVVPVKLFFSWLSFGLAILELRMLPIARDPYSPHSQCLPSTPPLSLATPSPTSPSAATGLAVRLVSLSSSASSSLSPSVSSPSSSQSGEGGDFGEVFLGRDDFNGAVGNEQSSSTKAITYSTVSAHSYRRTNATHTPFPRSFLVDSISDLRVRQGSRTTPRRHGY
ncbi:hypothetical protein GE09DRAFT_138095 [Coniochaeta sp. 2T2.1]|nr:hypothetical protein GE09DRAFT_138095 [Coniochaeta sp. 2T2.1]